MQHSGLGEGERPRIADLFRDRDGLSHPLDAGAKFVALHEGEGLVIVGDH